jgi:hypothetical protein
MAPKLNQFTQRSHTEGRIFISSQNENLQGLDNGIFFPVLCLALIPLVLYLSFLMSLLATLQFGGPALTLVGLSHQVISNVRRCDTIFFHKSPEALLPGADSSPEISIFASFESDVGEEFGLHTDEDEQVFC